MSTPTRSRRSDNAGYSLVELLVALGITTVIMGATMAGLSCRPRQRDRAGRDRDERHAARVDGPDGPRPPAGRVRSAGGTRDHHPVGHVVGPRPPAWSADDRLYGDNGTDWWPNTLYDAREGNHREVSLTAPMVMGGVMHYITLDVGNLKRWFAGAIGTTGSTAWNNNGYIVYFSDRRGNHDWNATDDPETGDYGWEDLINPASATGDPNDTLQSGKDVDQDGNLDTYGASPEALITDATATAPFDAAGVTPALGRHTRRVVNAGQARVNRTVLFRRALKLTNGGIVSGVNSLPTSGLTVASENPVYVQGNYNATTISAAEPNVPAAVVADAVSVLSNNWRDTRSFRSPNDRDGRDATTTGYRFAVIAGKNPSFTYPTVGSPQFLFGTDGGAGNFLRLLENWYISGVSINYRGSIISLYYSRQATGTFKYNPNVYYYGDRNFTFDTDFLEPSLLPPGTPMFRDINTLTFRQILRPNQ